MKASLTALRCAVLLAGLLAAQAQVDDPGRAGCGEHSTDCGGCLAAGCAWQPNTGGDCYPDCLIMDTSCYTGAPTACPQSEELCSGLSSCDECTAAGCIFQEGSCRAECRFGPLGDFIARCASDAAGCEEQLLEDQGLNAVVDTSGCVRHNGDCSSCLSAGCVYQPVLDGQCLSECLIADTSCYAGVGCPADLVTDKDGGGVRVPLPPAGESSAARLAPVLLMQVVASVLLAGLCLLG